MLCMHTLQTYNPKFYLTTAKGIAPHLKRSAYNIDGHSAATLAMDKRFQFLTIQLNLFITTETRVTDYYSYYHTMFFVTECHTTVKEISTVGTDCR